MKAGAGTDACARMCIAAPAVVMALFPACGRRAPAAEPAPVEWFTDRAAQSGLQFVHVNGMSGRRDIAEIMGAGVALLDYDNDGDLDVFFVQGGALPSARRGDGTPPASGGRLFRNDLTKSGSLHFTDVTRESGVATVGYGMGVATGDFDNDGCVD